VSPIFPVAGDGVSSVVPGAVTSKLTAKSAEAVTFTRLDIAESFSITTSRFEGAWNETTSSC